MDSLVKLYLERAENELELAKAILIITENRGVQENIFHINKIQTFYSAVISHAYYCIFYSAKAYLFMKKIKTESPEVHRKTFELFGKFVKKGILNQELLNIYRDIVLKADILLDIFRIEKKKRGSFTYQRIAQANKEPANQSLENARIFFRNIYRVCEYRK